MKRQGVHVHSRMKQHARKHSPRLQNRKRKRSERLYKLYVGSRWLTNHFTSQCLQQSPGECADMHRNFVRTILCCECKHSSSIKAKALQQVCIASACTNQYLDREGHNTFLFLHHQQQHGSSLSRRSAYHIGPRAW